jgi:hypothetical protein
MEDYKMASSTESPRLVPTRRPHGYFTLKPLIKMRLEHVELLTAPYIQSSTGTTYFVLAATPALRESALLLETSLYDAIISVCRQRFDASPEEHILDTLLSGIRERKGRPVWMIPFSERYTTLTDLSLNERYTFDVECRGVWISSLTDMRLDIKLLQVSIDEKEEDQQLKMEKKKVQELQKVVYERLETRLKELNMYVATCEGLGRQIDEAKSVEELVKYRTALENMN